MGKQKFVLQQFIVFKYQKGTLANEVVKFILLKIILFIVQICLQQIRLVFQNIFQVKYSAKVFAFNEECNFVFVAYEKQTDIYQFLNGVISQEQQKLTVADVYFLYLMKQSNSLIVGNANKKIIIWEFEINQNKQFAKQFLGGHNDSALFILMNKNEDLLISCGRDQMIKLWKKVNNQWHDQQSIDTENIVYSISLNELEDKMISLMQKKSENKWIIVQSIKANFNGIDFALLLEINLNEGDNLEIYDYNQRTQHFRYSKKVKQQNKRIIFNFPHANLQNNQRWFFFKHCKYLSGNYQLTSTIEFNHIDCFGRLTNAGQHLVTWDRSSKEIQVTKHQFQNEEY